MIVIIFGLSPNLISASTNIKTEQLCIILQVMSEIKTNYVKSIPAEKLGIEALKGMVGCLDSHSSYLTPDELKDLQTETRGTFFGVGIEIIQKNGALTVVSSIEGTPAFLAGIRAGDRIIKINSELTKNMSLFDAIKSIRGPQGTQVILTILCDNTQKLKDIPIIRDVIPIHSVRYNFMENGVGYIRILSFQGRTTLDVIKALQVLQSQKHPLRSIILDLRNNPGGLLQEAIGVTDQFIKNNAIVSTKSHQGRRKKIFNASEYTRTIDDYPVICLVNGGSASASEIVVGALQDHKRAIVIGSITFGKGSVQTIIPLDNNGALRLTTAHYYTPNYQIIQAEGIIPDMLLNFEPLEPKKINDEVIASNWRYNYKTISAKSKINGKYFKNTYATINKKFYIAIIKLNYDNQLRRALNLLKVWEMFNCVETKIKLKIK